MKHSLIRFSAVVLTIAFVFALTGCGSGSNSFTWFVDSIPANLDPQVASASADVIACENLYSGLVRKDPSGEHEPALCERWEKSSDGLTYTFYLKDGLTYTAAKGNATDYAITAEDFVFAFRRLFRAETNSPYAVEFAALENSAAVLAGQMPETALGVTASGPLTLVFHLSSADDNFLEKLTLPGAMPCDEEFSIPPGAPTVRTLRPHFPAAASTSTTGQPAACSCGVPPRAASSTACGWCRTPTAPGSPPQS